MELESTEKLAMVYETLKNIETAIIGHPQYLRIRKRSNLLTFFIYIS